MKTTLVPVLALLAACVLWSCQSDQKNTAAGAALPAGPTTKAVYRLYVTQYDGMRLREQPGKNASVLDQLPLGAVLIGSGEASAQQDSAVLGGIPFTAPYYRVQRPSGKQGWVFGAALQSVYAGPQSDAPDAAQLAAFSAFLSKLPRNDVQSGKKAWDHLLGLPKPANAALADAQFILVQRLLHYLAFDPNVYALTESLVFSEAAGFGLGLAEGSVFPVVDYARLQRHFQASLSPAMKAYLEQTLLEERMAAYSDGGIVISLEELADRAAFWEAFNRDNPDFPLREETLEMSRWTGYSLIAGADNTPSYDFETKDILPEYRDAWAYTLKRYPGTQLAAKVKAFQELCAAQGWKRTQAVDDYLGTLLH
jgi:hypothetical protein